MRASVSEALRVGVLHLVNDTDTAVNASQHAAAVAIRIHNAMLHAGSSQARRCWAVCSNGDP